MTKFLVIEYDTPLKQIVLNRLYFTNKTEICDYLKITSSQLENYLNGKIKGKRKSLSILQRVDIYRKYQYDFKTVEKKLKIGIKDFESMLEYTKENLKHVKELKEEITLLKNLKH
jgi:transcriptional regulator with XRE-family HTH domain